MDLKKISKEELEFMSYTDIAYEKLKGSKKGFKTMDLFKEICSLLNIDEDEMQEKITDFFSSMTTDKRFILLENGKWDLKENHAVKLILDEIEEEIEETEEIEEMEEESLDDYDSSNDIDEEDTDDLVIVDENELEEE